MIEKCANIKKYIKVLCFGILLLTASMTVFSLCLETWQNGTEVTQRIYDYNCLLCVLSIGLHITYFITCILGEGFENTMKKITSFFKKEWPCLLLVIFMGWTAVGCIQAGMEAKAEAAFRDEIEENNTQKNYDIAMWSSGSRMTNAADRAWNGCNNLKDGYFSFLFYAATVMNIIILGYNKQNWKKWLLRVMMACMIIIAVLTAINLSDSSFMSATMPHNRALFHNSNHYGYYLCIAVILCATMALKEKSISWKIVAFLGFALTTYMLILNNTFGAYLGVLMAMVCLLIYEIIQLIIYLMNRTQDGYNENEIMEYKSFGTTLKLKTNISKLYIVPGITLIMVAIFTTLSLTLCEGENKKPIVIRNFETTMRDLGVWAEEFNETEELEGKEENISNEKEENKSGVSNALANTGSGRGEVWVKAIDLIKQRPMFGWGLENLLNEFYSQFDINEGRTHNLILQLAGTTGVPGMLLYVVGVMAIFFRHLKRFKSWNELEYITMFCFISYMVSSMFGNSAFYTSPYFMIILGILITCNWSETIAIGDGKSENSKNGKNKKQVR